MKRRYELILGIIIFLVMCLLPSIKASATVVTTTQTQWNEVGANRVVGVFKVPNVTNGNAVQIWVGVEGHDSAGNTYLVQVGIIVGDSSPEYTAQEWYNGNQIYGTYGLEAPRVGSIIKLAVVPNKDGTWSMRFYDETTNLASWVNGKTPWSAAPVLNITTPTAAWAVESDTNNQIGDFGSLTFKGWPAYHALAGGVAGGCITTTTKLTFKWLREVCG